jgi:acyl-CoA dehydrogenase
LFEVDVAQSVSPWIDDELAMFRDHVARFFTSEFVPQAAAWESAGQVDRAAWRKASEIGLLCASIPAAYGGAGGTLAHEAIIVEEAHRAGLGGGFGAGNGVSSALVAHYILAYGTEAQRQRWLPAMARGERIGAIAMTEPGAGSDLQAIKARARAVDGGYRLDGQKTFISNGQIADLIVVVARTSDEPGAKGISLLVVETDRADGFARGRKLDKIGMHAQDTSELFFNDVFVPADNVLGEETGEGFRQLMLQLPWERLSIAIGAVVNMEVAIDLTIDHARARQAFGQRLIDLQNTQFVLADCKAQAVAGRALVDTMMVRLLAGELDAATAAAAKLWTTETQCRVIDACLQLFGGYGYMTEYPIARLYADARVGRIYGGTSEIMKLIIARAL